MKRASKFVTILGVKIPMENIRAGVELPGWVSYKFHFGLTYPPPAKINEYFDYMNFTELAKHEDL